MSLALEEKYDQVRQLIAMGKERGYLLYDEVNDILPAEVHSSAKLGAAYRASLRPKRRNARRRKD